jgi:hypothetical protein
VRIRLVIRVAMVLAALVPVLVPTTAQARVDTASQILTLDDTFTVMTAADEPAEVAGCAGIPGGSAAGLDGWVFGQPVKGVNALIYGIGFIPDPGSDKPPVYVGIAAAGVFPLPVETSPSGLAPDARTAGDLASRLAAAVAATPQGRAAPAAKLAETEPPPLPAGVAGGLLNDGADGAWLQTPSGWIIAAAALFVVADSAPATFDLTAVCLPPAATPTPPPATTAPATTAPASTSPPVGGEAARPSLPITGDPTGIIAGAGVLAIVLGVVLRFAVRRRSTGDTRASS